MRLVAAALLLMTVDVGAQTDRLVPPTPLRILTHREQADLVRSRILKRFDELLPQLMRREGIDMWIMVTREYNSDPVFRSMAPLTIYSSRRRSILVFYDRGEGKGVERLSVGRFDYQGLFEVHRTLNHEQWEGLREVVEARDPQVIGVNKSELWNHADGLTANEEDNLLEALGPKYAARVVTAEMLAVGWLETKIPEEYEAYRHVMQVAHMVIREAFSNEVIVPGRRRRRTCAGGCASGSSRWDSGSGFNRRSTSSGTAVHQSRESPATT